MANGAKQGVRITAYQAYQELSEELKELIKTIDQDMEIDSHNIDTIRKQLKELVSNDDKPEDKNK